MTTTPAQESTNNLREVFRIPVLKDSGLTTRLRSGDREALLVEVCDVTESGIRIEFSINDREWFRRVAKVDIEFSFRGESIVINGVITRLSESHCVVMLADPISDEQRREAIRWRDMKLALQQLWLKSRLK